ncbi:hypothetical protein F5Y17DRAFT_457405 [Xylariaceae sp. FL0594]|nr:hypothetical protein F5Y17DRAFT_457405 [Xylariaceae sp. FL0594]
MADLPEDRREDQPEDPPPPPLPDLHSRTVKDWHKIFNDEKVRRQANIDESSGGGGARLHPALTTPHSGEQTSENKSDSPSDEERALVQASANFGSLKDPFADAPGVPQSIPAAPGYGGRPNLFHPIPTPSRMHNNNHMHSQNGMNRQMNMHHQSQSVNRYRSQTFGNNASVPRFRQSFNGPAPPSFHPNGNGNHGNNFSNESDTELASCQSVFGSIMTAIQYLHVSPGMPANVQAHLRDLLQDVSQRFSAVTVELRNKRDEWRKNCEEEKERADRAERDASQVKLAAERANKDNERLADKIAALEKQENLLQQHINSLDKQLDHTQRQLDTLTKDAVRFQQHHEKVINDYKEQDENHYRAIVDLENEVKALRGNTTLSQAGHFSSPTQPDSVNPVEIDDDDDYESVAMRKPKQKQPVQNAGLQTPQFVPNPNAPTWAPSSERPKTAIRGGNDQGGSGSPGNSGDVVLYTGRGSGNNNNGGGRGQGHAKHQSQQSNQTIQPNNQNAMTPYHQQQHRQGPPAMALQQLPTDGNGNGNGNGGTAPAIRTPFGVVFGEYPTVEQNSRIPGEKMIPRDKAEWDAVDVQRAMAHLYNLCKGYVANCHMKGPPNVPYPKLKDQESYTWHYLMQQVYKDPDHAANHLTYLLSAKAFIPYLLQRTCVDYLFKKLLTPTVFIGFSEAMDNHLRALQGQLASIADGRQRHDRQRQRIIEDHATLIRAIAAAPEVSEFRRRTVDRHAHMMSALLEPCRSNDVSAETAAKSIRIMVAACWDISLKVWSSGKTLHYVFPECAHKFSPGTMEALNGHHIGATPEQLLASQCRVSLVITPTMTLRDDRDASHMQCYAIHKAQKNPA